MSEKESNRHLIDELEQYRRLLDNLPAELGVFDRAGRFLFNTPSGIRDPATREWVLGKTHHDWCRKRGHPMAIADRRQQVIETVVDTHRTISFEELWVDKNKKRRYYVRTFSPVLDETGEVTHVLGYGQEITELKKTEEALRVAHEELQNEVAVRQETEEELRRALAEVAALKERLHAENVYLREEIRTEHNFDEIVGTSPSLRKVLEAAATVGPTDANVVVYGETGTGKELVARAVHAHSGRKDKPLIKVNCASVPRELFESEFFGHVRGAFTGAVRDRAGRFELAHEGTLFLDEVGEIPLDMQAKLLRVLQEGEYERIGEERTRRVDVRMIAATNRDLEKEVAEGRFRQDLFYRLNVFPVEVPPLRARSQDVPLLAKYYLKLTARKLGRKPPELTPSAIQQLQAYAWPGNVRELQNVVERAAITAGRGKLRFDLPIDAPKEALVAHVHSELDVVADAEMQRRVAANLEGALSRTHGQIYGPNGAAALLGLKPTTLASRIERLGLASGKLVFKKRIANSRRR